jgi:hypothetical protein
VRGEPHSLKAVPLHSLKAVPPMVGVPAAGDPALHPNWIHNSLPLSGLWRF